MIAKLRNDVARAIRAQQYIQDAFIIIKELVENAIDAGASAITVTLTDGITVEDNGRGIDDLDLVCRSGFTSKTETTEQVLGLASADPCTAQTHGFRGQALAAIAELADVDISTRAACHGPVGRRKNYTTGVQRAHAREPGTTVRVTDLFKSCPLRRAALQRTRKRTVARTAALLQALRFVHDVHFTFIDGRRVAVAVQGSADTRAAAITAFGDVFAELDDPLCHLLLFPFARDRAQHTFCGRRSVTVPRLTAIIAGVFKQHFDYPPTFILVLRGDADVNMAVDKASVLLKDQAVIENKLREALDIYFSERSFIHGDSDSRFLPASQAATQAVPASQGREYSTSVESQEGGVSATQASVAIKYPPPGGFSAQVLKDISFSEISLSKVLPGEFRPLVRVPPTPEMASSACTSQSSVCVASELSNASAPVLPIDPLDLSYSQAVAAVAASQNTSQISTATSTNSPQLSQLGAHTVLRHVADTLPDITLVREDFRAVKIIGQFNCGFILGTLVRPGQELLVIVDQHAADEIYNFETLRTTFVLQRQQLIAPIRLNLPPAQALLADLHAAVLERNGFVIKDGYLTTVPMYKGVLFTVEDLHSLLDNIAGDIYESKRFRDIMASKACRSSVMIGTAIGMKRMREILDNLAGIERPWNCPHGRPTVQVLHVRSIEE